MRNAAQITATTLAVIVAVAQVACRRGPDMALTIGCVQLQPSETTLKLDEWDGNNNLGRAIHEEVRRMQLNYAARGFSGEADFTRAVENDVHVHVLLLVPEPVQEAAELPVPQPGADVVYLLRNGHWEAHPHAVTKPSRHAIRVIPDARTRGAFILRVTGIRGSFWRTDLTLTPGS